MIRIAATSSSMAPVWHAVFLKMLPTIRHCQRKKNVVVERLDRFDDDENQWQEAVIVDTRTSPVPQIVGFRVDFADWLAGLTRRKRRVAQSLAVGNGTGEVARRFNVSAGRVSQLRNELATSWGEFVGEAVPA